MIFIVPVPIRCNTEDNQNSEDNMMKDIQETYDEHCLEKCPACGGKGFYKGLNIIEDPCENCEGKGEVRDA